MSPVRIAEAAGGWASAIVGVIALMGAGIGWTLRQISRRFTMIDKRWNDRAKDIEAMVEVENSGQHTARETTKAELEARITRHEDANEISFVRLHARLDGLQANMLTREDGHRIETKLDSIIDKFVVMGIGGRQ